MKTWRNIFILGVLVGLAACTKVENVYVPETISYSVGTYANATKASEYRAYEGLDHFNSKSFFHAEGAANGSVFFESTIAWDGAIWAPSHDYYWPRHPQNYLNFVSWYAKNGSTDIVPSVVTETEFRIADREIEAQDRILIADEAWRQTSNITPGTYYTPGVPTLFHHLLSRVKVNMGMVLDTDPDNSNVTYQVILQEVRFEGLYRRGSLVLNNSPMDTKGTRAWFSSANSTYLWSATSGSNANNLVFLSSDLQLSTTPSAVLAERSFMPQELTNDVKMFITYTVKTYSGQTLVNQESDIPVTLVLNKVKNASDVAITQWLPNKIYTYNIVFNPINGDILLDPYVEKDWSFADDINVTVE